MYTAELVAKWFLARCQYDLFTGESDELISNLKLQKLLYYAQGSYLAFTDQVLFPDDIYAWEHGPVVPSIYHKYKENGANGITFDEEFDFKCIDDNTNDILEEVYKVFGQYSAWKLREITHDETPWKTTPINQIISTDCIKKYFRENYVEM